MAKMKEALMAKNDLLDNIQKFVLCGRAMLDAIEDLTKLYYSENEESVKQKQEMAEETPVIPGAAKQADEVPQAAEAPRSTTLEEVRAVLAEKSRKGFRAEVKSLLTAHGVEKLSDITAPAELGQLMEEANRIGVS